jgi:hypothetical protein
MGPTLLSILPWPAKTIEGWHAHDAHARLCRLTIVLSVFVDVNEA